MSRIANVASMQMPIKGPMKERERWNLECTIDFLKEAGQRGTDIVCLPKAFSKNGIPGNKIATVAQDLSGPIYEKIAEVAKV